MSVKLKESTEHVIVKTMGLGGEETREEKCGWQMWEEVGRVDALIQLLNLHCNICEISPFDLEKISAKN